MSSRRPDDLAAALKRVDAEIEYMDLRLPKRIRKLQIAVLGPSSVPPAPADLDDRDSYVHWPPEALTH